MLIDTNDDRSELTLYVAFDNLRKEKAMPSDAYMAWIPKAHETGDHRAYGYDIVFR